MCVIEIWEECKSLQKTAECKYNLFFIQLSNMRKLGKKFKGHMLVYIMFKSIGIQSNLSNEFYMYMDMALL